MKFLFDIIIPTYNNLEELRLCLQGFKLQTEQNFRLLICIDGSNDGTLEFLESYTINSGLHIEILQHANKKNQGRNATRNLALEVLHSDFVICCDSDCIPRPNFIRDHLAILQKQRCISVGDLEYTNAHSNIWAAYLHKTGKRKYSPGSVIPFYYATTGNMALPTDCFIGIGGQDAAMKGYGGGDTEFAYRLYIEYQLPVIYNGDATADSIMNKSIAFALDQMEEFGNNNLRYIRKKHPNFTELYKVGILEGSGIKSIAFRFALHPLFGAITETIAQFAPIFIAIPFLKHAVGSRILKGLYRSQ